MGTKSDSQEALQIAQTIAAECVGARVRMLNRTMTRIYDDMLRPHGLKSCQMNSLTVITLRGPIQPVQVAKILSIEKSTLSRNLRLMEANGWIESLPGDAGNTQLLRVTRQGRLMLKKATPGWRRAQERVTTLLGERTTAVLRRAGERVRDAESQE